MKTLRIRLFVPIPLYYLVLLLRINKFHVITLNHSLFSLVSNLLLSPFSHSVLPRDLERHLVLALINQDLEDIHSIGMVANYLWKSWDEVPENNWGDSMSCLFILYNMERLNGNIAPAFHQMKPILLELFPAIRGEGLPHQGDSTALQLILLGLIDFNDYMAYLNQ